MSHFFARPLLLPLQKRKVDSLCGFALLISIRGRTKVPKLCLDRGGGPGADHHPHTWKPFCPPPSSVFVGEPAGLSVVPHMLTRPSKGVHRGQRNQETDRWDGRPSLSYRRQGVTEEIIMAGTSGWNEIPLPAWRGVCPGGSVVGLLSGRSVSSPGTSWRDDVSHPARGAGEDGPGFPNEIAALATRISRGKWKGTERSQCTRGRRGYLGNQNTSANYSDSCRRCHIKPFMSLHSELSGNSRLQRLLSPLGRHAFRRTAAS